MRFGLFYELQMPRPWETGAEHRLFNETLDQFELADRLGYDYIWMVEHHFLEEYSHCSAPEVFLGAASQRTSRIRLGHGIMALPPNVNSPARVAERIATLDLISDGRVEFGSGASSTEVELGGFRVDRRHKNAEWLEALDAVTRMLVEEPFAGYTGDHITMPPRNVVPKPLQNPHPPLWRSCIRREAIVAAASRGLGALTFSFVQPDQAARWVRAYYDTLATDECVPIGFSVNPNVAMTLYLQCHRDDAVARARGVASHTFFAKSLAYYYQHGTPAPGRTSLWDDLSIDEQTPNDNGHPAELSAAFDAVGSPRRIRERLRRYEEAGVDQILLVAQSGRIPHEQVCESLELFAKEVMPEFHDRCDALERAKRIRLRPAVEAALARRLAPVEVAEDYRVPRPPKL